MPKSFPPKRSVRPAAVATRPDLPPRPSAAPAQLIYGVHSVAAAWLNPARRCRHLYATSAGIESLAAAMAQAEAAGLRRPPPFIADLRAIDKLVPAGSVHQGVVLDAEPLAEIGLDDVIIATADQPALLVMLDQVTDPHNVGAIVRSAAAFGARALIVQSRHAPDVTGVLAKAASGGLERVAIVRVRCRGAGGDGAGLSRSDRSVRQSGACLWGRGRGAPAAGGGAVQPRRIAADRAADQQSQRVECRGSRALRDCPPAFPAGPVMTETNDH
jgi:hypothetical protein